MVVRGQDPRGRTNSLSKLVKVKSLSCVWLFATPWTLAYHGIFQARVLEWVAISFSRGSSWPRDRTRVSRIVGRCFTVWATRNTISDEHVFHRSEQTPGKNTSKFVAAAVLQTCYESLSSLTEKSNQTIPVENYGRAFVTLYRRRGSRPSPRKRNAKKAKWLSDGALHITEKRREAKGKGEKERYTHLNAQFQRIARRR